MMQCDDDTDFVVIDDKEVDNIPAEEQSLATFVGGTIGAFVGDFLDDYEINQSKGAEQGAKIGATIGNQISKNTPDTIGVDLIPKATKHVCEKIGTITGDLIDDGVINDSEGAKQGKKIGGVVGDSVGKMLKESATNKINTASLIFTLPKNIYDASKVETDKIDKAPSTQSNKKKKKCTL